MEAHLLQSHFNCHLLHIPTKTFKADQMAENKDRIGMEEGLSVLRSFLLILLLSPILFFFSEMGSSRSSSFTSLDLWTYLVLSEPARWALDFFMYLILGGFGYLILLSGVSSNLRIMHLTIAALLCCYGLVISKLSRGKGVTIDEFPLIPILGSNIILLYFGLLLLWSREVNYSRNLKTTQANLQIAKDANRAKSMFISNVSHDLRTPLQGILGLVDLISATDLDDLQRAYINNIASSGNNLLCVVNNVLDFTKIEVGKMEISKTTCDIFQLMQEVVDGMSSISDKRGLEILIDIRIELKHRFLFTDPRCIRQILINILGNAIKFTRKGVITISLEYASTNSQFLNEKESPDSFYFSDSSSNSDKESAYPPSSSRSPNPQDSSDGMEFLKDILSLRFSVEDTGCGISKAFIPHCIEAFSQDRRLVHKEQGTGLGLSICQTMLLALGSKLQIDSEVNRGSTFSFILDTRVGDPSASASESNSIIGTYEFRSFSGKRVEVYLDKDKVFGLNLRYWFKKLSIESDFRVQSTIRPRETIREILSLTSEIVYLFDTEVNILSELHSFVNDEFMEDYNHLNQLKLIIFTNVSKMLFYNKLLVTLQKHTDCSLSGIQLVSKPVGPAKLVETLEKVFYSFPINNVPRGNFGLATTYEESCEAERLAYHSSSQIPCKSVKGSEYSKESKNVPLACSNSALNPVQCLFPTIIKKNVTEPRVLMVEDNIINAIVLEKIFELWDIPVDLAENGQMAVDMWKESSGRYELILMDAQMPVKDGFTSTQEIREIERNEFGRGIHRNVMLNEDKTELININHGIRDSVIIIMMTALASKEALSEAHRAGVDDFLAKPVRAKALKATLQKHLGK
jgi:signal transduction histidine kinase/CheY-like chemotaxis protein